MSCNAEFRKVIVTNGKSSLSVNLPSSYAKNLEIAKGDTVKIQRIEDCVTIRKVKENDD